MRRSIDLFTDTLLAGVSVWMLYRHGTDSPVGWLWLAIWCLSFTKVSLTVEDWVEDRIEYLKARKAEKEITTPTGVKTTLGRYWSDEEREERAASAARHPSRRRPVPASVEDHFSGPRKIVGPTRDGSEVIMTAPTDGSKPYMVHNHGPHEGRGLECPEYGGTSGRLRGACVIQADRQRAMKETNR